MEDLWKKVFPVGTEWNQLDSVYGYNWNFSNLEQAFEEGGRLHGEENVYLFASTEPQLVTYNGEANKAVHIPVVVAVVSPFPPSDKIGITSIQKAGEEIVPMKQMKMDWIPYIPSNERGVQVERLKKTRIHILSCTQRRCNLKNLNKDRIKRYEYCLPYFCQLFREDDTLEQSTVVDMIYPSDPRPPILCQFDWELDELEEFTDKLIEEEELEEDIKYGFMDFVQAKVREAKRANREAREARRRAIEEMSEGTRLAYENMRFYKFYPVQTPDTPDISGVKEQFINRYYRKAHEVL